METPNKSRLRRKPEDITVAIIHYTRSPNLAGTASWFQNPKARVSAHYLIERDGSFVRFEDPLAWLWHAGKSSWQGRDGCNAFSIGYELVGYGEDFPPEQIDILRIILENDCHDYPIDSIVGHEHVSPGRKVDPGPNFPWGDLIDGMNFADSVAWIGGQPRPEIYVPPVAETVSLYPIGDGDFIQGPAPMAPGIDREDRKGWPWWHPLRWWS